MNDGEIRYALKTHLHKRLLGDRTTIIVEELGLRHGAVRADVVLVNGSLHGFEIKSDLDTLKRFPRQIEYYNAVLTQASLVVGGRLRDEASSLIPCWWGVLLATYAGYDTLQLEPLKQPESNPTLIPLALAKLLWRDEVLAALQRVGAASGLFRKPKAFLYQRLVEVLDLSALQGLVCESLKARTNWRAAVQQT